MVILQLIAKTTEFSKMLERFKNDDIFIDVFAEPILYPIDGRIIRVIKRRDLLQPCSKALALVKKYMKLRGKGVFHKKISKIKKTANSLNLIIANIRKGSGREVLVSFGERIDIVKLNNILDEELSKYLTKKIHNRLKLLKSAQMLLDYISEEN